MQPIGVRTALILVASVLLGVAAGCVDVPSGIKANFAAPEPQERSNYRRGAHGAALPTEEPAAAPEAKAAQSSPSADAGTVAPVSETGSSPASALGAPASEAGAQ